MPTIKLTVTDKNNLVAERSVTFTNQEWDLVEESLKGFAIAQIANPNYDPNGSEDVAINPPTIPVPQRWHIVDQVEAFLDRGARAVITRKAKEDANQAVENAAAAASANKVSNDAGDDPPVKVDPA